MKVKFANKVFEVLYTMEVAGKTMYAVEDEPNHIDWLVNVEVLDDEKKESDKSEQEPYPETLDKAIDLYYYTYGNGRGGFDHLSLEQFKDIVKTFVDDYGLQKPAWSKADENHVDSLLKRLDGICRNESTTTRFAIGEDEDWLKSLKDRVQPQNTWKPTESELYVLRLAAEKDGTCLMGLYEQLKKLREE